MRMGLYIFQSAVSMMFVRACLSVCECVCVFENLYEFDVCAYVYVYVWTVIFPHNNTDISSLHRL